MNTSRLQDAITAYQQGRLTQARDLCDGVLKEAPRDFDALHLAGVIALQQAEPRRALAVLDAALAVSAAHASAHNSRGMALMALGRAEEALAAFETAATLKPGFAVALNNKGNALRALKRTPEALAGYDAALAARPDYAEAWNNRALVLLDLKNYAEARSAAERALEINGNAAEAHNVLGLALKALREDKGALASYDRALALKPDLAEAWSNRGIVLQEMKRSDEALASYDRALALKPDAAETWNNRGTTLDHLRRYGEAVASFERAVAIDPQYANAWSNRGVTLVEQGRGLDAVESFERCIALAPDNADARWNLSLCYLQQGAFAEGWALHDARWQASELALEPRTFTHREWRGEPLAGKTLLLHADQGFGDAVMFLRYAATLEAAGARVVVEVRRPLASLAATMNGVAEVVVYGEPLPAFDLHCPLGSLPRVFGMRADNVPLAEGYLRAPEESLARWRKVLGPRSRPRVGLAWTGNPTHKNNHNRSIALGELISVLSADCEFVSLQKQLAEGDVEILKAHPEIRDVSAEVTDFADTAALCALMDVVVTVDTSVAHVAGAVGAPAWILLPFNPDWRWMLGRSDTPWYASAKLYRQSSPGDWAGVLARIKADLKRL